MWNIECGGQICIRDFIVCIWIVAFGFCCRLVTINVYSFRYGRIHFESVYTFNHTRGVKVC